MTKKFDQELPADCPPENALPRDQTSFRIVETSPPTAADFKTHAQIGRAKNADPCQRNALSIYATYKDAQHRLDMSPYLGKFIARAALSPSHWLIGTPNRSGHMSWWAFPNMVRPNDFEVDKS